MPTQVHFFIFTFVLSLYVTAQFAQDHKFSVMIMQATTKMAACIGCDTIGGLCVFV